MLFDRDSNSVHRASNRQPLQSPHYRAAFSYTRPLHPSLSRSPSLFLSILDDDGDPRPTTIPVLDRRELDWQQRCVSEKLQTSALWGMRWHVADVRGCVAFRRGTEAHCWMIISGNLADAVSQQKAGTKRVRIELISAEKARSRTTIAPSSEHHYHHHHHHHHFHLHHLHHRPREAIATGRPKACLANRSNSRAARGRSPSMCRSSTIFRMWWAKAHTESSARRCTSRQDRRWLSKRSRRSTTPCSACEPCAR